MEIDDIAHQIQFHKDVLTPLSKHSELFDSVSKNSIGFQKESRSFYTSIIQNKTITNQLSKNEINQYSSLLSEELAVLKLSSAIGFKDRGAIARLRTLAHRLENEMPQFREKTLSLRRHEKDFIMRLDQRYLQSLNQEIVEWKNESKTPVVLDLYRLTMDSISTQFQSLYIKPIASFTQWHATMETVQALLRKKRTVLVKECYAISTFTEKLVNWVSAIAVFLLIIGSIIFTRKITIQVSQLQKVMNNFIASNYESDESVQHNLPRNELGMITLHFLKMSRKIRSDMGYLEDRVFRRTKSLEQKNAQLEQQHDEIVESLRYAQNLQQSMLVSRQKMLNYFKEAMVYYEPKNLVGGDFFWMKEIQKHEEPHLLFALADCTGHGVPGALLSVLGMNALDEIYNSRIYEPAGVLNTLRTLISRRLNTHSDKRMDGMDMVFLSINLSTNVLQFAAAQIPLWILRNEELIELKGQRMPIGYTYFDVQPYEQFEIELQFGDKIILFTDGFIDQFGNISEKKLSKKQLRFLLQKNCASTSDQLFTKLVNHFEHWKGNAEQTDDCTLLILEPKLNLIKKTEKKVRKLTKKKLVEVF